MPWNEYVLGYSFGGNMMILCYKVSPVIKDKIFVKIIIRIENAKTFVQKVLYKAYYL